ncbi:MAG: recombinase family protein [Bacteroidales bacterium]|nr:recombinase family protein [Bacteroidales bacterium]
MTNKITKKKYISFARVSSREQEREGFSLDVQESGIQREVERRGGEVVKAFRVAETATRRDERIVFREMLAYAKQHLAQINGVIVYKLDRAARNLKDYLALEDLEEQGLDLIVITQPTENTPAGRMMRRTLATFAAFQTEQQSVDVREGQQRRVMNGLFMGAAPFGYRNVRVEKRGLVEVDPVEAAKLRRIFELYAYHRETLDSLIDRLDRE